MTYWYSPSQKKSAFVDVNDNVMWQTGTLNGAMAPRDLWGVGIKYSQIGIHILTLSLHQEAFIATLFSKKVKLIKIGNIVYCIHKFEILFDLRVL